MRKHSNPFLVITEHTYTTFLSLSQLKPPDGFRMCLNCILINRSAAFLPRSTYRIPSRQCNSIPPLDPLIRFTIRIIPNSIISSLLQFSQNMKYVHSLCSCQSNEHTNDLTSVQGLSLSVRDEMKCQVPGTSTDGGIYLPRFLQEHRTATAANTHWFPWQSPYALPPQLMNTQQLQTVSSNHRLQMSTTCNSN